MQSFADAILDAQEAINSLTDPQEIAKLTNKIMAMTQCEMFNTTNEIGKAVSVLNDDGVSTETVTAGQATLAGETAVVWLVDNLNAPYLYLLDRVTPRAELTP